MVDRVELQVGHAEPLCELARECCLARAADAFDVDAHGASVGSGPGAIVGRMTDPVDKAKEVVESLEHPIEKAKELEKEAEEGSSPRTPLIVITGVGLVAAVTVVIVLAIAFTVYFVYGGK
jgi:hypothetical protein